MNFKYAIFDMDGTLVDSLMVWDLLWSRIGEKYLNNKNFKPDAACDKQVRTMLLADAMDLICDEYGAGESGKELLEFTNNFMAEFYRNDVKLKNGVKEFLDYMKKCGAEMCIATATDMKLVKIAVKSCELDKYFEKIISCADVGKGKDKPDVFFAGAEYLGADIKDVWVFEDSATALETAKNAGFKTVGIYDKYNFGHDVLKKNADIYIDDGESLYKLCN